MGLAGPRTLLCLDSNVGDPEVAESVYAMVLGLPAPAMHLERFELQVGSLLGVVWVCHSCERSQVYVAWECVYCLSGDTVVINLVSCKPVTSTVL